MKNEVLHRLISKLTPSEKRQFSLSVKKTDHPSNKKYIHLFELFLKRKKVTNEIIEQSLTKAGFQVKYLSGDKHYLYQLILKNLRENHQKNSKRTEVYQLLINVEILWIKGLKLEAKKQLLKTKKIALAHEFLFIIPEILRWERKIQGPPINLAEHQKELVQHQVHFKHLENFIEQDFNFRKINSLRIEESKARTSEVIAQFDFLLKEQLEWKTQKHKSAYTQIRNLQSLAAIYYTQNQIQKEFDCNKIMVEIMEENTFFFEDHPIEFINIYSRYLILSKTIQPDLYTDILKQFQLIPTRLKVYNEQIEARVFVLAQGCEFTRLIHLGLFNQASKEIPSTIIKLKYYQHHIDEAFIITSYFRFAFIFFANKAFSQALDFLNLIIQKHKQTNRKDIYRIAHFLHIIVHFELKNNSLLPYLIQAFQNLLKRKNKLFQSEKIILKSIQKSTLATSRSDQLLIFKNLYQKLIKIYENPLEKNALGYFNFIAWAQSKAEEKDFKEVVRLYQKNPS